MKLFTTYKPGKLNLGGGIHWISETDGVYQGETINQASYMLENLMSKYDFNHNLSAKLDINNLFDKNYNSNVGSFVT
ncbi:hypothetical protein [Pseudoalteromonas sp. NCIMB_1079]|uniref:hypothetical protein n=1 Tax=Pseudoalteromonas sp. NCIMB 1079 TaxID=3142847 RepID=UPI00339D2ABF